MPLRKNHGRLLKVGIRLPACLKTWNRSSSLYFPPGYSKNDCAPPAKIDVKAKAQKAAMIALRNIASKFPCTNDYIVTKIKSQF
mgnify:CR=1